MSPRPSFAMKLIASGVANCAAMVRSPSFSRSAASTTTTIFPWRMSSIASSTVANWLAIVHVDLEIHRVAGAEGAQCRLGERVRDQRNREPCAVERRDRERDTVDGDRAL